MSGYANATIYARAVPTALPIAYGVNQDYIAQELYISVGRMLDTTGAALNGVCGFRIYRGAFGLGWLSTYNIAGFTPEWVGVAEGQFQIPWGAKMAFLLEFYGPAAPASPVLDFTIRPYSNA